MGVTGASAGTLAFMCGTNMSENGAFVNEVVPFLSHMGRSDGIFYCGSSGTGSVAKMCNNMALAIQMVSVSEAINLGVQMDMDPKLLSNVMNKSSSRCWSGDSYNPCPGVIENVPAERGYEGGFKVSLMLKDLLLAKENAAKCGATIDFGIKALELYEKLNADPDSAGFGPDKDFGIVYKYIAGKSHKSNN